MIYKFEITSQTAGTGTWTKDDYAFAYTFVYDGNQESAPYIVSSALAKASVNEDRPWKLEVYAANATAATDYDARITGLGYIGSIMILPQVKLNRASGIYWQM